MTSHERSLEIVEGEKNVPFFIISCGRSGSSLLSRMLNCHPRLAVPGESHLFKIFYRWLKYYGDLNEAGNRERLVDDILSTFHIRNWSPPLGRERVLSSIKTPTFAGVVDAVMKSWAESQGKMRWGEKTPQHVYHWREILECFPQGKVIHIVRDGRDVAASFVKAPFGPKTFYAAAKRWVRELGEIEQLKATIAPGNFHEIRYEELLDAPEPVLSGLCDFLGECFAPDMLEFYKRIPSTYAEATNSVNLKQPLLRENKEKWRTRMHPKDLRTVEAVAWNILVKYRYDLAFNPPPRLSGPEKLYRHYVESPLRKLIAMIRHRDGQEYELTRLRIFLGLKIHDLLS